MNQAKKQKGAAVDLNRLVPFIILLLYLVTAFFWITHLNQIKIQNQYLNRLIDKLGKSGQLLTQAEIYKIDKIKEAGSGVPAGQHYNLNIIGVPKEKAGINQDAGHVIYVPLESNAKIRLYEGTDFAVIDKNATDGQGSFQLPNPDPSNVGTTTYSIWARALGKPGGQSTTATCAVDELGEEYCSVYATVQVKPKGKQSFTDISRELLYVFVDLDSDGRVERYPIFDEALQDYFWSYDNQGLKLLQLRFYSAAANATE
jgi:hypothetical protein